MARQMIRYNKTGEVRVIDAETMTASEFLSHDDQDSPLPAYQMDDDLAEEDLLDYTVLRDEDTIKRAEPTNS